jgi:hypothetical protein
MPRRETRLGIVYIENDQERQTTFSKRRSGLYKRASDLYALTGARVVVILEKDNGKMYSFGTPSADPIIDAFLSEGPPIEPFIDEVTNARIASLQREVDRLETNNAREEKREKLSLRNIKEIKDENPGMIANYIFSKEEDLSLEDLKILFNELMRIKADITDRLHPLYHGHEPNINDPNIPQNLMPLFGPSGNCSKTIHSSSNILSSHHLPRQVFPPIPVPATQQHTWEPHFPIHVPQTLQSAPPHLALESMSPTKRIYGHVQELPPPLQPHLQNNKNPYNLVQSQNYAIRNPTLEHSVEASTQFLYSSRNDFPVGGIYGYENSSDAPSNQTHRNDLLGMDAYMGYNGTYEGPYNMECDGWVGAPPGSALSGKDVDSGAWFGRLP